MSNEVLHLAEDLWVPTMMTVGHHKIYPEHLKVVQPSVLNGVPFSEVHRCDERISNHVLSHPLVKQRLQTLLSGISRWHM
jgi:hypothetical protein